MNQASTCPFCSLVGDRELILESATVCAIYDKYPVSKGHALVIPTRHVASYFDLTLQEQMDCLTMLNEVKAILQEQFKPDGFNVGINIHAAAGQTVAHAHIHIIPRYRGDVPEPRGGVRGVIPGKQSY